MNKDIAILLAHKDPAVRAAAERINEAANRKKNVLSLVQEALGQLRLDMKYLMFDLDCTRNERDEAVAKLAGRER